MERKLVIVVKEREVVKEGRATGSRRPSCNCSDGQANGFVNLSKCYHRKPSPPDNSIVPQNIPIIQCSESQEYRTLYQSISNSFFLPLGSLYSLVQSSIIGCRLSSTVVSAILVHDAHELHPWIVLCSVAHTTTLPHRHHLSWLRVCWVGWMVLLVTYSNSNLTPSLPPPPPPHDFLPTERAPLSTFIYFATHDKSIYASTTPDG